MKNPDRDNDRPGRPASDATPRREDDLPGPPPGEAIIEQSLTRAQRSEGEGAEPRAADPKLTGGDPDADWQRAHMSGEEAVGGHVDTPDKDDVDAINDALGVPRAPGEPVRASSEILDRRDQRRRIADE